LITVPEMTAPQMDNDPQAVLVEVQTIFRDVLRDTRLVLDLDMQTGSHPAWDSFANVEILMRCEEVWHLRFSSAEIDRMLDIRQLVTVIASKISAS
jgi:acyl carrier protein